MKRKKAMLIAAAALLVCSTAAAHEPAAGDPEYLGADLNLAMEWFEGRFDNNFQVEAEKEAGVEEPLSRLHSIFTRVDLPEFGDCVYYGEQYGDTDPTNIYRQRLYIWTANTEENM